MRSAPPTDILLPSQRRQHPIARLALAGLVHGHDPEFQAYAARLVGEGNLGIHGHARIQPSLRIAFPALDTIGRLAALFLPSRIPEPLSWPHYAEERRGPEIPNGFHTVRLGTCSKSF
uniref:Uncharacterized protein n=1 Tax=Candidatus Kentrum sp. TC TaxID=2126339 RepID=A0A450YLF9_9GAMM|nr:MAG: hypothetical protein BECKTC1821E_GA0114239_101844 [Candidatus Kentron sp. TC]